MKKGQKSKRNGVQDFLCPFTDLNITQKEGGNFSHKNTKSVDVAGKLAGAKDPVYAPCDVIAIKVIPEYGQTTWQSLGKVRFANGRIAYATFVTVHDDHVNYSKGYIARQGEQIANMGTAGNATGVHTHIQISQSKDTTWKQVATYIFGNAKYPVYGFNDEYSVDKCWFIDGTNVINNAGYSFKKLKDVGLTELDVKTLNKKPKCFNSKIGNFIVTADTLKILNAPNTNLATDTGYVYKKNDRVTYDGYVNHNGYRWISWISKNSGKRRWMKCGKVDSKGVITKSYGKFIKN